MLGIAAGNGRASDGVNQGVAYESDLLVVKMGIPRCILILILVIIYYYFYRLLDP